MCNIRSTIRNQIEYRYRMRRDRPNVKDTEMAHKHSIIAAAALAGLLALSMTAKGAEPDSSAAKQPAQKEAVNISRDVAEQANNEAVLQAIRTVRTDTKLDLDIKLIGPTSVKIASKR
jgi:hypothetical protein